MANTVTPSDAELYGAHYYRTYRGAPYERNALWLETFGFIADRIVRDLAPRTVLDAGCGMGMLVEALRDRGVDAWGVDVSAYAVSQARDDIKPFCRVGSFVETPTRRYDTVVCHEVIEHLPASDAAAAVAALCASADDVLFSSTPDIFDEDTHLNVRPPEYWAGLFAQYGFTHDLTSDTSFLSPWAFRFRKSRDPMHRVVVDYERRLWELTREVAALRKRGVETAAILARHDDRARARVANASAEQTAAEQQDQLDALHDRLQFMSDHESELRRLLVDAHQQLLERDRLIQSGAASISYVNAVRRVLKPFVPAWLRPILRRAVGLKS